MEVKGIKVVTFNNLWDALQNIPDYCWFHEFGLSINLNEVHTYKNLGHHDGKFSNCDPLGCDTM
jgi:hypothetical protein